MIRWGSKHSCPLNHLASEAVLTKPHSVCVGGSVSPVLPVVTEPWYRIAIHPSNNHFFF